MTRSLVDRLLQNTRQFDPARDGQVPLRRDPLSLALRMMHLSLRMGLSRHPGDLLVWVRSMLHRRWPLSMAMPWLTFDAIRFIDQHLVPGSRLFEYGSGHSTLYWALRGICVYSMEDNSDWYSIAQCKLSGLPNAEVFLAHDECAYVHGIDTIEGGFDVVLVDGAFRMACLAAAIPRVRPGGLLVVDNTDWHWFNHENSGVPSSWLMKVFNGSAPFIGHSRETLENPGHPRDNGPVSAGQDWGDEWQAARLLGLRADHRQEADQTGEVSL